MNKVLDAALKYGPLLLTLAAGFLSSIKEDKDRAEMVEKITKDILKGLKK